MNIFSLIKTDISAKATWLYGSATRKTVLKACLTDGTFAMITYRLMQWSHKHGILPLAMLFNKINIWFGGCIIGRGADFGPGLVLIHSNGIVINTSVRGGRDIKIEHQVTIGAEKEQSPLLGDEVFIGAGAKIIGAVKIGSRAKIGANAVVVSDIPADTTAVGIPAKPVNRG